MKKRGGYGFHYLGGWGSELGEARIIRGQMRTLLVDVLGDGDGNSKLPNKSLKT